MHSAFFAGKTVAPLMQRKANSRSSATIRAHPLVRRVNGVKGKNQIWQDKKHAAVMADSMPMLVVKPCPEAGWSTGATAQ